MITAPIKTYEYDRPQVGEACSINPATAEAWARVPAVPSAVKSSARRMCCVLRKCMQQG